MEAFTLSMDVFTSWFELHRSRASIFLHHLQYNFTRGDLFLLCLGQVHYDSSCSIAQGMKQKKCGRSDMGVEMLHVLCMHMCLCVVYILLL